MAAVSNTSSSPPCREYRGHIAKRLWSFCRRTSTITSPTKPDFGPNHGTWAGSTSRLPERTLKRGRSRVQRAGSAARPCSDQRTRADIYIYDTRTLKKSRNMEHFCSVLLCITSPGKHSFDERCPSAARALLPRDDEGWLRSSGWHRTMEGRNPRTSAL